MEFLRLLDLPHTRVRSLLQSGAPVYLHVNPVEYHGPHLSLHNDRLISHALAARLHARLWPDLPLVHGGDLEVGAEPAPGPGTRTTPFSTVRCICLEAARSLRAVGARRVVLMTFHGAPLHNVAIQAAVDWLRDHGVAAVAPFHGLLRQLAHPEPALLDAAVAAVPAEHRDQVRADLPTDFHAGTMETSLALALAPDSVSSIRGQLPPCPRITPEARLMRAAAAARLLGRDSLAEELRFAAHGLGWLNLRPFPGYTGRPAWASAAIGEAFAELLIDRYAAIALDVLERKGAHPKPILSWLERASLGGRWSAAMPLRDGDLAAVGAAGVG